MRWADTPSTLAQVSTWAADVTATLTVTYRCACVEDTTCAAAYATARILVWHIMHTYSRRCGRYNVCRRKCLHACLCGRLCDRRCGGLCNCMHAYVADSAVRACLHGKLCNCMPTCVEGYAIACMLVCHIPLVMQIVANCATACVANYAATCVPLW